VVLSSDGGVSWDIVTSGFTNDFRRIAFGKGRFVATGPDIVAMSSDGRQWSAITPPVQDGWRYIRDIAFGHLGFIIVGWGSAFSSTDGTNWKELPLGGFFESEGITYGANRYVVSGYDSILTSTDGAKWIEQHPSAKLGTGAYGGGMFLLLGLWGNPTTYASTDGANWSAGAAPSEMAGAAYGISQFAAVGQDGNLYSSTNGLSWTLARAANGGIDYSSLRAVCYGPHGFVAAGNRGMLAASSNGIAWTQLPPITDVRLSDITWGAGLYVAVGDNGTILTSANGQDWTLHHSQVAANLSRVTFGEGAFVAIGLGPEPNAPNSHFLSSSNGVDWIDCGFHPLGGPSAVAYGNGVFAASSGTDWWVSTNGTGWSPVVTTVYEYAGPDNDIAFGNGMFVSVGVGMLVDDGHGPTYNGPHIGVSATGNRWSYTLTGGNSLQAVAFGSGSFVAVGYEGEILTTTNGHNFERRTPTTSSNLTGIAFGNDTFVAVGSGIILQSDPVHVHIPPPRLTECSAGSDEFGLTLEGTPGVKYRIERSTDLTFWVPIAVLTPTNTVGTCTFREAGLATRSTAFYRAIYVPQ
jgi:hypothetical protein